MHKLYVNVPKHSTILTPKQIGIWKVQLLQYSSSEERALRAVRAGWSQTRRCVKEKVCLMTKTCSYFTSKELDCCKRTMPFFFQELLPREKSQSTPLPTLRPVSCYRERERERTHRHTLTRFWMNTMEKCGDLAGKINVGACSQQKQETINNQTFESSLGSNWKLVQKKTKKKPDVAGGLKRWLLEVIPLANVLPLLSKINLCIKCCFSVSCYQDARIGESVIYAEKDLLACLANGLSF